MGTTSIEDSEKLSSMLKNLGVPHEVLNAKHHEREAQIVAQAGRPGAITVSTNMAGRGTDIVLGGNAAGLVISPEEWQRDHDLVISLGGLHVIGTEHHDARRIDNQLRGRAGRQGDPGGSRFYASLEDELFRRFGGDRIKSVMNLVGLDDSTPIENRIVTKSLESAQVKVEGHHFEIRKHLLDYDDVLNNQRRLVYAERGKGLKNGNLKSQVLTMTGSEVKALISTFLQGKYSENWNMSGFLEELGGIFLPPAELDTEEKLSLLSHDKIEQVLARHAEETYDSREALMGSDSMRTLERLVMLRAVDVHWVHHLTAMDNLRQGIVLHAFGQRDPLVMYKTEGSRTFQALLDRVQQDIVHSVYRVSLAPAQGPRGSNSSAKDSPMVVASGRGRETVAAGAQKVGRNEPCPCDSGKKYKRCHGASG